MTTVSRSPFAALALIGRDIKLAHSVFALPFAVLGAFMAAAHAGPITWTRFGGQLVLIVLAMFFARTVAMLANRLFDRHIDRDNPRTSGRALPSGRLSVRVAYATTAVCGVAFMFVCAGFGVFYANWWPLILGAPVLAWISAYALLKRYTMLCHVYLGSALAISPIAAALAIDPASLGQPSLWLLSAMVLGWVAGFDIIYALQDVEIDRAQGLHSIPSRLGTRGALLVSRSLHVIAVACLAAAVGFDDRFGVLMTIGVGIVATLLIVEHATIARWGRSRMALAFFTLNGVISCVLGVLGVVDVVWG